MQTKKFILTALTFAAICTAALSTSTFANDETTLKCYDNTMYRGTTDSTDNGGSGTDGAGGNIIPVPGK